MCYVFHVEPSAGPMAKTIEAACKLRYQKVLDAHTGVRAPSNTKVSLVNSLLYVLVTDDSQFKLESKRY